MLIELWLADCHHDIKWGGGDGRKCKTKYVLVKVYCAVVVRMDGCAEFLVFVNFTSRILCS